MLWVDYAIMQSPNGFTVKGDWPNEAWENEDGTPKEQPLYKPGDKFVVNEDGWLVRTSCQCNCACGDVGC
tara:strand:- start:1222 stop:1431 length:210 start_codon:yes stop_codon:yes gene_type:complete